MPKQAKQQWPYKLTCSPDRSRWIKKHRGKQYYFTIPTEIRGNVKAMESHCRIAWKTWWLPLVGKLESKAAAEERERIRRRWEIRQSLLPKSLYSARRLESRELFLEILLGTLVDEFQVLNGKDLGEDTRADIIKNPQSYAHIFGFEAVEGGTDYHLPAARADAGKVPRHTIEALIAEFKAEKQAEVERGSVSKMRVDVLSRHLAYLAAGIGEETDFGAVTEETVRKYHRTVLAGIAGGAHGDVYGHDLLATAKQFFRWCLAQSKLVRLLDPVVASSLTSLLSAKNGLAVKRSPKEVDAADIGQVKTFLASVPLSPKQELFAMLALNAALIPSDMADVRWSEIVDGVLTRKRHKQRDAQNVPTVSYPLWARTQELIATTGKKDGEFVIGKNSRSIDSAYRRAKCDGWLNLGQLKKCSASLLAAEYDATLADLWLGHAPAGIGLKHYIRPDMDKLAAAVRWLEGVYFPAPIVQNGK